MLERPSKVGSNLLTETVSRDSLAEVEYTFTAEEELMPDPWDTDEYREFVKSLHTLAEVESSAERSAITETASKSVLAEVEYTFTPEEELMPDPWDTDEYREFVKSLHSLAEVESSAEPSAI